MWAMLSEYCIGHSESLTVLYFWLFQDGGLTTSGFPGTQNGLKLKEICHLCLPSAELKTWATTHSLCYCAHVCMHVLHVCGGQRQASDCLRTVHLGFDLGTTD